MQFTTPAELHTAIVTAIQALTPSHPHAREKSWHYKPEMREFDIEGGGDLRWFYLVHGQGTPAASGDDGFFFGNGIAYRYELRVVTSYSGVPATEIDFLVDNDGADLWWGVFEGMLDPTTPGLYAVEPQGNEQVDDGSDNVTFVHRFSVVYNRNI